MCLRTYCIRRKKTILYRDAPLFLNDGFMVDSICYSHVKLKLCRKFLEFVTPVYILDELNDSIQTN